jgi:uncharacterized protein (DUF885 family)
VTPIFDLCAEYVQRVAALDPVTATMRGFADSFVAATDYSPDGNDARAELARSALARLAGLHPTGEADRLAAAHLRERLEAETAWHDTDEPLRHLKAHFGPMNSVHDSVALLPRDTDEQWHHVAQRLAAVPAMLAGWRSSLSAGLAKNLPAARRQAVEAAAQAESYIGTHAALLAEYRGNGALSHDLTAASAAADAAYADLARYLREEYAPRAAENDGVGPERYAVAARLILGADLDARDAYEWGWAELHRIEAEMAAETGGRPVDEVIRDLDLTQYVDGAHAYRGWLQERHDWAIGQLHGVHFDIAAPLHTVEVTLATGSKSGSAYYTAPSEDLTRPGRTWWPTSGRSRFSTWSEHATVFHEGVPGHHLQNGAVRVAGAAGTDSATGTGNPRLSRFARVTNVSGHSEGWALYSERFADELGWYTEPGSRLGMLVASAVRAARVVIDIGVHLDLPLPDGSRWTFETAADVLRTRGRAEPHRVHAEIVRYLGWPAQAISYKLGERTWLAARAEAQRRPAFDLKAWHTAALNLGPVGLETLTTELRNL